MVYRRFYTHFFLTFLDDARGGRTHHLPTSDGGLEIVATRFIKPAEALDACHAQSISLMPPQYYILSTLAGALSDRRRVEGLARGPFGHMLITPRALPETDTEGRTILTYEGDESRGGPKGRLHRSLIRWGPRGVSTYTEGCIHSSRHGCRSLRRSHCSATLTFSLSLRMPAGRRSYERGMCVRG
jgi:hypothetical protein